VLDWLSSKVAMTLAALFLLAGVAGFFVAQRDRAVQDGLQTIADEAAAYVDEVTRSAGALCTSISIGSPVDPPSNPVGLELPALAAGRGYLLVLHGSFIVADDGGRRAESGLRVPVHLWEPGGRPYSVDEIAILDATSTSLSMGPGGSMAISRQAIEVDGMTALETFAYL